MSSHVIVKDVLKNVFPVGGLGKNSFLKSINPFCMVSSLYTDNIILLTPGLCVIICLKQL